MNDSEVSKYRLLFVAAAIGSEENESQISKIRNLALEILEGLTPEEVKKSVELMVSPEDIEMVMTDRLAA